MKYKFVSLSRIVLYNFFILPVDNEENPKAISQLYLTVFSGLFSYMKFFNFGNIKAMLATYLVSLEKFYLLSTENYLI